MTALLSPRFWLEFGHPEPTRANERVSGGLRTLPITTAPSI
jgi:hypothetical protein